MSRVLAAIAVVLLIAGSGTLYGYSWATRRAESALRDSLVKRDRIVGDSLEAIRAARAADAAAALAASAKLDRTLHEMDRRIDAMRQAVSVVNATHVTIVDTSGARSVVEIPAAVVQRLISDSATIDTLRSAIKEKDATIDKLVLARSADSVSLKQKDDAIAHLNIPVPQPSFIDRAIAHATVPLVKAGLVGGILYGGYRVLSGVLHR